MNIQRAASVKELTMLESVALSDLFGSRVPVSASSLVFNLARLNGDIDDPLFGTIEIVYQALTRDLNNRQRKLFFNFIVQEVECQRLSATSLLTFVRFEADQHIVCQAVWSYLLNRRPPINRTMLATEELLNVIAEPVVANPGAVYAGLVCFGDRKVCAAARMIRHTISAADARDFAAAVTTPLHRATMDFCIYWLVDLLTNKQYDTAMQVAYALSGMVIKDTAHMIYDREQQFGPLAFKAAKLLPETSWNDWLIEYAPILDTLSMVRKPAIEQMLEIFANPDTSTMEQLERRKHSSRRKVSDRRASDRRIVNITPILERRSRDRRNNERRTLRRRT